MSRKRGLSLDEKRERLLQAFHDSGDVFVLKEVEKLGVSKGITLQSVKEVLQSLVDDDLVHQEKIGSSNYFWSFPSEEAVRIENEVKKYERLKKETEDKLEEVEKELAEARVGKEASSEREEGLAAIEELEAKERKVQALVDQYEQNDPQAVEAMKEACGVAKDAANRWLDNLYALEGWCKKQFVGREDEIKSFFRENGMTDDIDYLE